MNSNLRNNSCLGINLSRQQNQRKVCCEVFTLKKWSCLRRKQFYLNTNLQLFRILHTTFFWQVIMGKKGVKKCLLSLCFQVTEMRTGPLGCSNYDNLDTVSSVLVHSPENKVQLQGKFVFLRAEQRWKSLLFFLCTHGAGGVLTPINWAKENSFVAF